MKHRLFEIDSMRPGELRAAQVGSIEVVVARKSDGSFCALRNRCPHQGGPLAAGRLERLISASDVDDYEASTTTEVVRCPWHQFEFDVDTGRSPSAPDRYRVKTYRVLTEEGHLVLER